MNKLLLALLSIGILSVSLNSSSISINSSVVKKGTNISKGKPSIETPGNTNIKDIPTELFGEIFSFSSFKDIGNLRETCNNFSGYQHGNYKFKPYGMDIENFLIKLAIYQGFCTKFANA